MHIQTSSLRIPGARHGVALVIVLAMLVLLSALLVAFMSTATTERGASYANAGVSTARQIADSTVSLVISQIREATADAKAGSTWASQPGAIRTFSGRLSGRRDLPKGAYYDRYVDGGDDLTFKLYSADVMKLPTAEYQTNRDSGLPGEVDVIQDWESDPARDHVDLNKPILSVRLDKEADGTAVEPHYPIIDPRAAYNLEGVRATGGQGIVEGFDAKITTDTTLKLAENGSDLPYLPLPVKWLYVLRDGTIGPADRATEDNPIVGRTAFWTDDESCKLNLNTASEGTFWDTPTGSSFQEAGALKSGGGGADLAPTTTTLSFAASQPIKGEYQRYPGHPATTSLSPALGWMWGLTKKTPVWPTVATKPVSYQQFKEAIYGISPFLPRGNPTSQGATKNTDYWLNPDSPRDDSFDKASGLTKLDVPTKHLFTSIDEAVFKPARFQGASKDPALNDPNLTPAKLEKVRFFLTTSSRAPELTLFGTPRVTLWPVHADPEQRTSFDDLFTFTSTISKGDDPNSDLDDRRYNILRYDAKNDLNDMHGPDLKEQNKKMFRYLQDLTSRASIPGFGGSFEKKWEAGGFLPGTERDVILTAIFDYTRSVNLVDTGTASRTQNVFIPYTPKFFPPGYVEGYGRGARSVDWSGQVTPLKLLPASGRAEDAEFQGQGRFPVISEVALVFHGAQTPAVPPAKTLPGMQAVLVIETATTMPGYPALRETYWTRVKALEDVKYTLEGEPGPSEMGFPKENDGVINIVNVSNHEIHVGRGFMATLGFANSMHFFPDHKKRTDPTSYPDPSKDPNRNNAYTCLAKTFVNDKDASKKYTRGETVKYYPYVSKVIPTAGKKKFKFTGGSFRIEVFSGEAPSDGTLLGDERSRLVQTLIVTFPPDEVKDLNVPDLATSPPFQTRLDGQLEGQPNVIREGDVVRSMEFTGPFKSALGAPTPAGDLRLATGRTKIPADWFTARDGVNAYKSSARLVHGLTIGHGGRVTGHTGPAKMAPNAGVRDAGIWPQISKLPILPRSNGVVRSSDTGPGDWDRGLSKHMDGAFGNKVDEGNLRFNYADGSAAGKLPYFRGRAIEETGQTFFTPNRQLPSAVMLGSIPTGVVRKRSWETLLFRPDREGGKSHPGAAVNGHPPDHLLLDLFHIPVVEPYAISEPFSTAGKVNLNSIIAPFGYAKGEKDQSYVRRDTAVRGLLKSTFIMAVPTGQTDGGHTEDPHTNRVDFRFPIDLDATMAAMETRLRADDTQLFRSASEICNVDLYPSSNGAPAPSVGTWADFWNRYALTGDNMRERPYAHIYPRVTTKSNVYTVHMRTQAIRKSPRSKANEFDPELDQVVGDYRGSATIERFIDPNDRALAKYKHSEEKVDPYYRYRVINTKHFAPR